MKLVNLASLDPAQQARNIAGLRNASNLDRQVWDEFHSNWEQMAIESSAAFHELGAARRNAGEVHKSFSVTEVERTVKTRVVQGFFRDAILAGHDSRCCFCGFDMAPMLIASHIIPWKDSVERRADPTNGLCLCSFHDSAFDKGFLGVGNDNEILLADELRECGTCPLAQVGLLDLAGTVITPPERFAPAPEALMYHRETIFRG